MSPAWRAAGAALPLLAAIACSPGGRVPEEAVSPAADPYPFVQGFAGRIRYDDVGTGGLPVVFVHGNGGNRTQWSAQVEHLRPGRRVVTLDLRGFGESDRARNADYSVGGMAEDVAAVVDALNLKRFVLVGHSFGGPVSIAYLGAHPERVAGILLVDPSGDPARFDPEEFERWLDRLRGGNYPGVVEALFRRLLKGSAEGVEEAVIRSIRRTPKEVFVGALESLMEFDPVGPLERYSGPKLTIVTEQNQAPYSLQNAVDGLPYRLMTGVSHWLMMDRPDEFNRRMDEFLAGVDRTPLP